MAAFRSIAPMGWGLLAGFALVAPSISRLEAAEPDKPVSAAVGRELFAREWFPNDPRSHGGDGLGPVFNDSSCVACHNQGGPGGAGAVGKNVDILSADPVERNGFGGAGGLIAKLIFPSVRPASPPPKPRS